MRKNKKIIFIALTALILTAVFTGCKNKAEIVEDTSIFLSFQDIPGVTENDIKAVDALREQILNGRGHFVYGALPSTEAFYNDNGQIRGFSTLFCEWLTKLFDIPFKSEIVAWDNYLAAIENFDVDFSGDLASTEELQKIYFMTSSISTRTIRYYQIAGSTPIERTMETSRLRCGFIENTSAINPVTSTLESDSYEIVLVKNIDEAYKSLKSGAIHAFFNSNIAEAAFDVYGYVVVKDFQPLLFSPTSLATLNPALEPIISVVQKALEHGALKYLATLYNEGYEEYLQRKLSLLLTEKEKEYIKKNPEIKFVAEYYNYPISFYNIHEHEWQGIAFELLSEIERLSGLSFVLANDEKTEWPDLLRMVEEGTAPLSAELVRSKDREGRFLWPKKASFVDKFVLISKSEYPNLSTNEIMNARVGLTWGSVYAEVFNLWFPEHSHTVEYTS